jgi:hypothetical protein
MTGISGWMEIIGRVASHAIRIRKITRHTPVIIVMSTLRPGLQENIVKRGSATMTTASSATGMQAENTKLVKVAITGKAGGMTIDRRLMCCSR